MPTILIALLAALVLGLFLFLIYAAAQRLASRAGRQFEVRFQAAQELVNQGQVPTAWIGDYRRRIDELRRSGASHAAIAQVGDRAKRHCLRQIRSLYSFLESGNYYDSLETKVMVLETLQARQAAWQAASWQELVDQAPQPAHDAAAHDAAP